MKREYYYSLIFIAIAVLLVGISLAAYWNVNAYMEEVKWVRHSNNVIAQVEKVLSIVKDAETGHRGFQLTKDDVFLRPYDSSVETIYKELKELDSLFLEEDIQRKRGDTLRLLIDKQYRIIETILKNEEESKHFMDRYETNLLIVGRENMEKIRGLCDRIATFEEEVLQARLDEEYSLKNIAPFTLLIYGFIAISASGFLYGLIYQELQRRRKTQGRLKEKIIELDYKERRYRSLFQRSIDPIFVVNEDFEILEANESLHDLFNIPINEVDRFSLNRLFFDKNKFEEFKTQIVKQGQIRDFEVILRDAKGKKLICLITCVFISDQLTGEHCYQGLIHDITLRKKAERNLIQAEKLSTTGKLARTIAHEVRNPLTNLNLSLDQLKEEIPDNETTRISVDILKRNIDRIEELISKLLNSSRPRELQLSMIRIDDLANETIDLIKDRLSLNEMKLTRHFEGEEVLVSVDKELVKIALLNIMVNAIEAMSSGTGVLDVAIERNDDQVLMLISDNGKGIDEESLDNLFDPFFTAKHGGMGLGLTSTQSILNSHGIGIEVKSKVDQGTTFIISFPIN
ncbi:MAG: CHASE3 domain-containing protein [Cyclobacteriaceae bacterium]|nr:CHASE3 domain-containing protein [Cyclobacteriaceae bacterium]